MTEKQFRLVNEFGDYHIKDGDEELCYDLCSPSMAKENWNNVVNRLNELAEKNNELQFQCNLLREQANEFHRGARENANRVGQLEKENKELKNDEKQLSIDFLGYKMKLRKVLQRRYDKAKGQTLYADVFLEIAEEMGIDLE